MIISMRPHASKAEIEHVRERIQELGFRVHSIEGDERVVIGVVGVGANVEACLEQLEATPGVSARCESARRISSSARNSARRRR
jgi:3-deoxy-7-phosphoheptulonate synthase